jgi:hypothetical protein
MNPNAGLTMYRTVFILLLALMLMTAGCTGFRQPGHPVLSPVPVTATMAPTSVLTTIPATSSPIPTATPTTVRTVTPRPTPTQISEEALNARIVDARNKLNNYIDSNVADTIIIHNTNLPGCEIKKSKELGYLIDATTGESTFIKGDYWSIDASLFSGPMNREHEYVIIHTHPHMWATCGDTGIVSQKTLSDGDLVAAATMTGQGYHIKYLIALSEKEYRIWPKTRDGWKSEAEIRMAVIQIERRLGTSFTYYDTLLDREYYDMDSIMPLLAKELNYSYTVNNDVIS